MGATPTQDVLESRAIGMRFEMAAVESVGAFWYYVLGTVFVAAFVCAQFLAGKPKYAIPSKDRKKRLPPLMDCGVVPGLD